MNSGFKSDGQRLMEEYEKDRTRCPVCGKWVKKQKNGRVRNHRRELMAGTFLNTYDCPGVGKQESTT